MKGSLEALGAMVTTVHDHESRLRSLERKTAVAVPVLGTISLSGVAAALVQLFSGG